MIELMSHSWDSESIAALGQWLVAGVGTGFVSMVAFYLVGIVIDSLVNVMKGSFFWK